MLQIKQKQILPLNTLKDISSPQDTHRYRIHYKLQYQLSYTFLVTKINQTMHKTIYAPNNFFFHWITIKLLYKLRLTKNKKSSKKGIYYKYLKWGIAKGTSSCNSSYTTTYHNNRWRCRLPPPNIWIAKSYKTTPTTDTMNQYI